jgi:hypothetical protein
MDVDPTATTKETKTKGNVTSNKKTRSPSPKSKQRQPSVMIEPSNKKKHSSIHPTEIISDQLLLPEPIEERQRPALELQQLNAVIFGLPNLTFAP